MGEADATEAHQRSIVHEQTPELMLRMCEGSGRLASGSTFSGRTAEGVVMRKQVHTL